MFVVLKISVLNTYSFVLVLGGWRGVGGAFVEAVISDGKQSRSQGRFGLRNEETECICLPVSCRPLSAVCGGDGQSNNGNCQIYLRLCMRAKVVKRHKFCSKTALRRRPKMVSGAFATHSTIRTSHRALDAKILRVR